MSTIQPQIDRICNRSIESILKTNLIPEIDSRQSNYVLDYEINEVLSRNEAKDFQCLILFINPKTLTK